MRKSTDLGMTWSAAGALGVTPAANVCAHYFAPAARWVVMHDQAGRGHYSPDLVTWTVVTGAGAAPTTPRKMAHSSTACVVVYSASETVCGRSADGITWTFPALTAAGHTWRGVAYNSVRSTWMAVALDAVGARSVNDGLAWTQIVIPTGAKDVQAFGRFFVAVCERSGVGHVIAVSEDIGDTWAEFPLDSDVTSFAYDRLLVLDGRLCVLGRDTTLKPQAAFSLRAPWMPVPGDI